MNKLSLVASVFSLIGLTGSLANAQSRIVCTRDLLSWSPGASAPLIASGRGPAILVDFSAKTVVWVGTGGYIDLNGSQVRDGVRIDFVRGSRPTAEAILQAKSVALAFDTIPAKYGTRHNLTLKDSLGGNGYLQLDMDGIAPSQEGTATWTDDTGSKQNFAFCTTLVSAK